MVIGRRSIDMAPRYLAWIALALWAKVGMAEPPPTVTWALYNLAPAFILVDGAPTNGFIDTKLQMVIARWPEAQHVLAPLNSARGYRSLDEGQELCAPGTVITPEREKKWYITPIALIHPQAILARKEAAARIPKNKNGEVDAQALLGRSDLRGVYDEARSYSSYLDALIAKRPPTSGLVHNRQSVENSSHLKMLAAGRADYIMEYEFVYTYAAMQDPAVADAPLQVLNIHGMQAVPVGVACPKTAWGYAAIKKIDAILKSLAGNPAFENAEQQWLTPQGRQRYHAQRAEFYRKRAQSVVFAPPLEH